MEYERLQEGNSAVDIYLARIRPRFIEYGFLWEDHVASEHVDVRSVAARHFGMIESLVNWREVVGGQFVFIFTAIDTLTPSLLHEYSTGCERFVWHQRPPRSSNTSYIMPVILTYEIPSETRTVILESKPTVLLFRWNSPAIIPVVYDLEEQTLLHTNQRSHVYIAAWGRVYRFIQTMLTP